MVISPQWCGCGDDGDGDGGGGGGSGVSGFRRWKVKEWPVQLNIVTLASWLRVAWNCCQILQNLFHQGKPVRFCCQFFHQSSNKKRQITSSERKERNIRTEIEDTTDVECSTANSGMC